MKFWNKLTKNDKIFVFIFIAIMILGFYKHIYDKNESKDIKANYEITIGKFEKYDKVGGTGNPYITYSYEVNDTVFFRQVSGLTKYENCYKNNDCRLKRFCVIYLKSNPKESLIDLTRESYFIDKNYVAENLDNFK